MKQILSTLLTALCLISCAKSSENDCVNVLLGSYGPVETDCIRLYSFNQETGASSMLCGLRGISNPSYLEIAPDNQHFYAVSEQDDSSAALFAAEIRLDADSISMHIINSQPTDGGSPCYVKIFPQKNSVFTANFGGGSFTLFKTDPISGALLTNRHVESFESYSRIHCVEFTPDSNFYMVNDLGSDNVMLFGTSDSSFNHTDNFIEQGSGPRHIVFAPNGNFAYLLNEKSGKVTVFAYDGTPSLRVIQYADCDSVGGHGSADIHISSDGKYIYASNRLKADGISVFRINESDGTITKIAYQLTGIHPRNFALSPNGKYLLCACRDSNCIQIYRRNSRTGLLHDTGMTISMSKPTCVKFMN